MTSRISEQLKSKFTRTCNSDLTVFSLRRFLSLLHCDETRENTRSTNALLTGIEKTLATNFYTSGRESIIFRKKFHPLCLWAIFIECLIRNIFKHIIDRRNFVKQLICHRYLGIDLYRHFFYFFICN